MLVNELTAKHSMPVAVREWLIGAIVNLVNAACEQAVADERAAIRQAIEGLSPAHRTAWAWQLLALATIDHRAEKEGK